MDEQIGRILTVDEAMNLAIEEARKGASFVSPNPLVGCVILDAQGRFLSSGYHEKYGGPHAEVNALKGLKPEQLKDAHVIVTLEPCAHQGKTPSCAKTLAQLPIKKVTYGLMDPFPQVSGQGAEILRAAGIEVKEYQGPKEKLEDLTEVFLLNQRQHKIFVALKVATSLDGQIALKSGESQWITGEESRQHVHYLRSCYDGILVGSGTLLKDNPSLNIRHPKIQKTNKLVVLDPQGEALKKFSSLKISMVHDPQNIFWCVSDDCKEDIQGLQMLRLPLKNSAFDFDQLMQQLWERGLRSLFVEGGSQTYSEIIRQKWVHRLYVFVAPHLMGAGGALSWTQGLAIPMMKERWELQGLDAQKIGLDILLTAKFRT